MPLLGNNPPFQDRGQHVWQQFPCVVGEWGDRAYYGEDARRAGGSSQLILDNLHKFLHAYVVVCPVTHNLQTVSQIAVGIGEVRLQFQGGPVGVDGLRDASRILVDGSQVAVSISKSRIYLDSAGVALHGTLDILHLFQGVTHITVRIGKCRGNAYCFLIVHEGLMELSLLLEHTGNIRMGYSKLGINLKYQCSVLNTHNRFLPFYSGVWCVVQILNCNVWAYLQSFVVKLNCFFCKTLLPFDVCKVIEGVCVGRTKGKGCIIAVFSIFYLALLLKSIGQVAISIWEVGLELDSSSICVYGQVYQSASEIYRLMTLVQHISFVTTGTMYY